MLALLALAARAAGVEAAPRQQADDLLPVPGGVPALARLLGLEAATPRVRVMLAAVRMLYEVPEGVDRAADARRRKVLLELDQLSARSSPDSPPPSEGVPLPMPPSFWQALPGLRAGARQSLLSLILGDRRAALAYHGLCAMDRTTRAYLAAQTDAPATLLDARLAPVLAMYGRSLRIRDGRIDVPGGPDAVPIWEQLAGAPVAQPLAFIARVLGRDGGRLAIFYDTMAHLDPAKLAFAMSVRTTDPALRAGRVTALYAAAAVPLVAWDPTLRPFSRVAYDATQLLVALRVTATGDLVGPARRMLWDAAFERQDAPVNSGARLAGLDASPPLDAAMLVSLICVADQNLRRERTETWLFAQRAFAGASRDEMADLLFVLRGYAPFRALIVTLDRMGLTRPATYAAAVRRADRLVHGFDRQKSTMAVALFQGALALVERARFHRVLDAARADALVASLNGIAVSDQGEYLGGVAAWIERDYLAQVGTPLPIETVPAGGEFENRVLAALAGATSNSPAASEPPVRVEWEGQAYRVDTAAAELARLLAIRSRQGAIPLDAALALARLATRLRAAASKADVDACLRVLDGTATTIGRAPGPLGVSASDLQDERILERLRAGLLKLADPPNPNAQARLATLARQASDACLAQALLSLAYTPHLGDGGATALLLAGDPARRHAFGLDDGRPGQAALNPWRMPEEERDRVRGWYVAGSILNLDVALGRLSLRRLSSDQLPDPPTLRGTDRQALSEAVFLMSPADQRDAVRDGLLAALARGRQRLASLRSAPAGTAALSGAAGLDEWRTEALSWVATSDPGAVAALLSLGDLVRLGAAAGGADAAWDVFGTSAWPLESALALRYRLEPSWTTLSGRNGTGLVAASMPDLVIGIQEALAERQLPATLTRGVLAIATQDLVDHLHAAHDDDWITMIATAQALLRDRFDDYVASLTAAGPLVPARQGALDGPRH